MDRSFLSDERVVSASRNFVCIRLATYESKAEAEFTKSIFIGRSGQLENTTFAILSHNGQELLARPGRGPSRAFVDSDAMSTALQEIAAAYLKKTTAYKPPSEIPWTQRLDLALNIAAADKLPLIVVVQDRLGQDDMMERFLGRLAWSDAFLGQFVYTKVSEQRELAPIMDADTAAGILVVHPGTFGLTGRVLLQWHQHDNKHAFRSTLTQLVRDFPRWSKDHESHVQLGLQLGLEWKSRIQVTDQQSLQARARQRQGLRD